MSAPIEGKSCDRHDADPAPCTRCVVTHMPEHAKHSSEEGLITDVPQLDTRTSTWVGSTYFAEGLPWSFLHQIVAEYFTGMGLPAREVGLTSTLHFGTALKVLWSPIVGLLGTLRHWMIATQALMGVGMGLVAVLAERVTSSLGFDETQTGAIWLALGVIAVVSATHDIACDGYYMDALGTTDQARYSGGRVAAFRIAMLVGSSGLVFLGGRISWMLAFATAAMLMLVLATFHLMFLAPGASERKHASMPTQVNTRSSSWSQLRAVYASFLRQDKVLVVIAFVVVYKLGDAMMLAMSKVLLRELAVPTDLRGILNAFSMVATIIGAVWGGVWIARKGLDRSLAPITWIMSLAIPLYIGLATFQPLFALADAPVATMSDLELEHAGWRIVVIGTIVVVELVCTGFATTAQTVFIMQRCHPDYKTAHYAFATAIYSSAQLALGAYSGFIYEAIGSVSYFTLCFLLTLPAVALVRFVPK